MMRLLAKGENRKDKAGPPTIAEHCRVVRDVATAVWESIGADLDSGLGSASDEFWLSIVPLFQAAALLHDLGKANSAFQDILPPSKGERKRQPVRHEILAGVLLTDKRFWGERLTAAIGERKQLALAWAVAGHHLQIRADDSLDRLYRTGNVPKSVTVYCSHPEVAGLLAESVRLLSSDLHDLQKSDERFDTRDEDDASLQRLVREFVNTSFAKWRRHSRDDAFKLTLAILKALLIASDAAGSALPAKKSA